MINFAARFEEGLDYAAFIEKYGSDSDRERWESVLGQVVLTEGQQALLGRFTREMKVLVLAGTWCGDCVNQCPIFEQFAQACELIQVRWFDRDAHPDLAGELTICGGKRVPVVVFLSEDGYECGRYGDRTLSRYRNLAARLDGAACSTGIVDDKAIADATQDWLDEFERIQWMLRTSGRLRKLHED